jgi:hypothetical protein
MAIQGTVPVGGSFAPTDPADSFGTHNDKWGIGGYRIVKNLEDRALIPVNESGLLNLDDPLASGRKKLGMMVYVSDEAKFYVLTIDTATWDGYTEEEKVTALADDTNFVEFSGGGGSGILYGTTTYDEIETYTVTVDGIVSSYETGDSYLIKFNANNIGNTKLNINGVGEIRMYKDGSNTFLEADDIIADKIYLITYDGENFQLVTSGGGGTANTGNIRFQGSWIKNVNTGNIFISPQDGTTWLTLPSDTQASAGSYVQLASSDPDSGGVYISTFDTSWHNWEFRPDGTLHAPGRIAFGDINYQSIGIGNVNAHGGSYGISLYCSIGYELNWQGGFLAARDPNSPYDLRPIYLDSLLKYTTPEDYPTFYATFDNDTLITQGYLNAQGYLISFTESDPIYTDSSWYSTTNNAGNWDTAYGWGNHASAGYLTDAPSDTKTYGRKDGAWSEVISGGGSGDMLKSTYDVDNDGIVDKAERIEIIVRNSTGSTLTKGQIVYLSGATGNRPNALLADASDEATSSKTIGMVVADILNNADGNVAVNGTLHDLVTNSFAAGDTLWLSTTAGEMVANTPPAEPNHTVFIGYVARAHPTQGRIVLAIQNGYELNELHGVDLVTSAPVDGDVLAFVGSPTNLWRNISSTSLSLSASNLNTGTVPLDRLGTNSPTTNTYLAWDNTWRTATASGTIASGTARRLAIYTSTTGLDDTLDAGNTAIVVAAHATGRVYTIDNVGAAASFVMTQGTQSIVGTKSFTGSAGPLQFTQIGVGTFTAPAIGATPSAGTRIVIAPGDASNIALSLGWTTNYEYWIAGRNIISFYPRNQTSSVGAFEYVLSTAGTTGLTLTTAYGVAPALRTLGWLHVAGATTGAVPTLTTARSVGTKIILRDSFLASTNLDAAIGTVDEQVGSSFATLWFTAPRDITFYTNSGTTERFRINSTGLSYNTTKILGSRITGWGTPGGTLTRATIAADSALATPTQAEFNALAQNVRALITDLRTHGLIGT